jgi:ADP-ribosylglycohydrolase
VYYAIMEEANRVARKTGFSTVKYWIENDVEADPENEMPKPHYRPIEYVKTSLLWTFYHLKNCTKYEDALTDILSRGGETSMNAAIVGGLIGALHGINDIPEDSVKAIKEFQRLNAEMPNHGLDLEEEIIKVYRNAPRKLTVIWDQQEMKDL